jgi:hypothetical protein
MSTPNAIRHDKAPQPPNRIIADPTNLTKRPHKRTSAFVLIVSLAILTVCCLFAIAQYHKQTKTAIQSAANVETCVSLGNSIEALRNTVPKRSANADSREAVLAVVRKCLREHDIPEASLLDLRLQERQQIAKTKFTRFDSVLTLKEVKLETLFAFINALETSGSQFICSAIELSHPKTKSKNVDAQWEPRLTLTRIAEAEPTARTR